MLQHDVLQCVYLTQGRSRHSALAFYLQQMCCSVLQRVAMCCSVLQRVAVCLSLARVLSRERPGFPVNTYLKIWDSCEKKFKIYGDSRRNLFEFWPVVMISSPISLTRCFRGQRPLASLKHITFVSLQHITFVLCRHVTWI